MASITDKNGNPFSKMTVYSSNGSLYIKIPNFSSGEEDDNLDDTLYFEAVTGDGYADWTGEYLIAGISSNDYYFLSGKGAANNTSLETTTYSKSAQGAIIQVDRKGSYYTLRFKDSGYYIGSSSSRLRSLTAYSSSTCDWIFQKSTSSTTGKICEEDIALDSGSRALVEGTPTAWRAYCNTTTNYKYLIFSNSKFQVSTSSSNYSLYLFRKTESPGSNFTITFNASSNGGSCSTSQLSGSSSSPITLPSATRSGYIFEGWYTAASGGTRVGRAGTSFTPTANTTLYAQFSVAYTVTFNVVSNGGLGTTSSLTGNSNHPISLPDAWKTNHTFKGWYTAATGGDYIGGYGTNFVPTKNITLYAQFNKDYYNESTIIGEPIAAYRYPDMNEFFNAYVYYLNPNKDLFNSEGYTITKIIIDTGGEDPGYIGIHDQEHTGFDPNYRYWFSTNGDGTYYLENDSFTGEFLIITLYPVGMTIILDDTEQPI